MLLLPGIQKYCATLTPAIQVTKSPTYPVSSSTVSEDTIYSTTATFITTTTPPAAIKATLFYTTSVHPPRSSLSKIPVLDYTTIQLPPRPTAPPRPPTRPKLQIKSPWLSSEAIEHFFKDFPPNPPITVSELTDRIIDSMFDDEDSEYAIQRDADAVSHTCESITT